jgi:hypothetical protein
MRRAFLLFNLLLAAALLGCQSAALPAHGAPEHRLAIEQVLNSFGRAIAEKNKALYMSLFFSDKPGEIGWQYVSEDTRLAQIRKKKPDAIKARRIPGNNFVSLIDESVGTNESREEKFFNVHIDTDGEIASVLFDYEFYAAGKKTNWGKEHWQLVRTERGWKIPSVVYTIRDELSSGA